MSDRTPPEVPSTFATGGDTGRDMTFKVIEGKESVRQRVIQAIRMHLGEWFLTAQRGIPYNSILRSRIPTNIVGKIVPDRVRRQVDGVRDITSISVYDDPLRVRGVIVDLVATIGEEDEVAIAVATEAPPLQS